MIGRGCGDFNDLAAQAFDQRAILGFRVDDDNVVIRGQRDLRDLSLGCKGFTGTGDAEDKAVAIQKLLAVGKDEILGNGVLPVVDAVSVPNFLRLERHEHGKGFRGQRPQRVNAPQTERQRGDQTVLLLEAQFCELAQVFSRDRLERFRVAVQFLFAVCQMHERDHGKQHPLVAGREVVQHLAGFLALLFQIIRHNSGEVLVAVLPPLPVGDVGFHAEELVLHLAHGFVGRHGDHVDGEHHAPVKVGQLQNHAVFDVAGVVFKEQHTAILTSHLEIIPMEFQTIRADCILEIMSALHGRLQVERQCRFFWSKEAAQHIQSLGSVQLIGGRIEPREFGGHLARHARKECARFVYILFVNGNRDEPLLFHAGGAAGDFAFQHPVELVHESVEVISALRKQNGIFKRLPVDLLVADRELGGRAAVQSVQQFAVAEEHRRFILFRGNGIVDVRKAQRSGIFRAELKNPIREDSLDGNDVLHAARDFICRSVLLDGVIEGFNQASAPPALYCCPIKALRTDSVDDMTVYAGRGSLIG